MSPKAAFIWLVVSVLLVQIHQLVDPNLDGNIFPFEDYPQSLQWYVFSLCKKITFALLLWVYASREPTKWLSRVVMVYASFESKEVFDYILMANKNAFVYDVAMCLGGMLFFLWLDLKKIDFDSFDYWEIEEK